MNKFKKIILFVYSLVFINLLICKNLFSSVIIFLLPNLYFSVFSKISPKNIYKLFSIEFIFWIANSYFILLSDINSWFLALNNLLWLLTSIKMIEVKNDINNKNIVLLLILCIGTSSLFNIGLVSNLINLISLILLIYSLLVFNRYKSGNIIKQFIVLFSFLPFTFLSFLNIPSPKPWLNQNLKTVTKTGISNKLSPGDISSLVKNKDLAARVFFSDNLPKPENRYWRVFVLDRFKNNAWYSNTNFDERIFSDRNFLNNDLNSYSKKVSSERWIIEPNNFKQRPWSGRGNSINNLHITDNGVLLSSKESRTREEYFINHSKNTWRGVAPKEINFKFNEVNNKLILKLAKKWLKESSSTEEILEKSKEWFSKGDYSYSINPGVMNKESPYDDFLFIKKKGFCEHFAGTFALLMRYANIPARVVVGFQGGELFSDSKNKNYILIDNSYAHAWNEVWIKNKGWVRIDPTSWVFPDRIQESSLITQKNNSIFTKFQRNISLKYISYLTELNNRFSFLSEEVRLRLILPKFSENIIFNRIYYLLFFFSTLSINISIILLLDLKNKNNFLRKNLNIYFYLLRPFKIKRKKGETLKSFSLRFINYYPRMKNDIKKIYQLYYSYKFGNKSFSKYNLLVIYINLTYSQIRVLSYILVRNFISYFLNLIRFKQ